MLREIFRRFIAIISSFSPKLASRIYYTTKVHKHLNLKKPRTFNEKLMWLKFNEYQNNNLVTKCVDKYEVREYVKECGLEETLNPLLGVYDNVICHDKNKLDIEKTRKQLNKWLRTKYWKFVAEVQYKNVKPKIVCERYLESKDENAIEDYKIYCFNGIAKCCMICLGRNLGKPAYYFFDPDWKLMKINPEGVSAPEGFTLKKPASIDKMYEYAEKLSKPFKFVRVDFFDYKDKAIFGELTFTPAGCVDLDYTDEGFYILGDMIDLK